MKSSTSDLLAYYGQSDERYIPLEYIESTGTQWIDTGIYVNQDTDVEIDYQYTQFHNSYSIFGCNPLIAFTANSVQQMVFRYNTLTHGDGISPTIRAIRRLAGNKAYVNGDLIYTFDPVSFQATRTALLFARSVNTNNNIEEKSKARLFSCKIRDGSGTLIRDFVPMMRVPSNIPGLYDRVEGRFYENMGTGRFLYKRVDEDMPQDGLVLWHPLDTLYKTLATGQDIVYAPELTSARCTTIDGVPCIDLTGAITTDTYCITTPDEVEIVSGSPITMSIWLRPISPSHGQELYTIGRHPNSARFLRYLDVSGARNQAFFSCNSNTVAYSEQGSVQTDVWTHLCGTCDSNNTVKIYVNGSLASTTTSTSTTQNGFARYVTIGCYGRSGQSTYLWINSYISSARMYSRALTPDEIVILATERKPVTTA